MSIQNSYYELKMKIATNLEEKNVLIDSANNGLTTLIEGIDDIDSETINITGQISWVNSDNSKPNNVNLYLVKGKTILRTAQLNQNNQWSYSFNNAPVDATVVGEIISGYRGVISKSGNTYTYTLTKSVGTLIIQQTFDIESIEPSDPEDEDFYTQIPVIIMWEDNNNQDGNRPQSVTVTLWGNGLEVESETITASDGWRHTFEVEKRDEQGNLISYSLSQSSVNQYSIEIQGFDITNNYQPETTSYAVQIIWDDNNDELGYRPSSVTMTLSNGMNTILNAENNWITNISDVPIYSNGQQVTYTWSSGNVQNYTVFDITTVNEVTTFTYKVFERTPVS